MFNDSDSKNIHIQSIHDYNFGFKSFKWTLYERFNIYLIDYQLYFKPPSRYQNNNPCQSVIGEGSVFQGDTIPTFPIKYNFPFLALTLVVSAGNGNLHDHRFYL